MHMESSLISIVYNSLVPLIGDWMKPAISVFPNDKLATLSNSSHHIPLLSLPHLLRPLPGQYPLTFHISRHHLILPLI